MAKKIGIGLVGLVAVLLIIAAMQPAEYRVERSAEMQAPADVIYAEVADFKQWDAWSAWAKSDPEQKTTITGEPGTVGHKSEWLGEKTGSGSMTLSTVAKPNSLGIDLEFLTPMAGTAKTTWQFDQQGDKTNVTWAMDGKNDFMGKLFGLFMDMDAMIGPMYEQGLASLKEIAEANAKKQAEVAAAAPAEGAAAEAAPAEAPKPEK